MKWMAILVGVLMSQPVFAEESAWVLLGAIKLEFNERPDASAFIYRTEAECSNGLREVLEYKGDDTERVMIQVDQYDRKSEVRVTDDQGYRAVYYCVERPIED